MKISTSVWTGLALLAMAQAAEAAPPKVSGKYALMIFTQCQAGFTTTTDTYSKPGNTTGPAIKSLTPVPDGSGELNIAVGTITFPATAASSGNATFEALIVSGALLRINGAGGAVTTHTEAPPAGPYSFTNTTFTFTPAGEAPMTWTFRAGDIVNGVARTLHMVRRENARCVNAVTATKQ